MLENTDTIDISIPNHTNELIEVDEAIEDIKFKINLISTQNLMDDELHDMLFEDTMKILVFIGDMSVHAFNTFNPLEEAYVMKYPKFPAMSKKLWLEHYDKLHHPYDLRKNRCFTIIDKIDNIYINKYHKNPPNWDL